MEFLVGVQSEKVSGQTCWECKKGRGIALDNTGLT